MAKLTYDDLLQLPLENLGEAVAEWKDMVSRLDGLAKDANDGMAKHSDAARWEGANSDVTKPFVRKTADEFRAAHTEAQSIWTVLSQAHDDLEWAQTNLKTAVSDAQKRGFVVMDKRDGTVGCEFAICGTTPPKPEEMQAKQTFEDRINSLIAKAEEIDGGVAQALGKSHGNDSHNFARHAVYRTVDEARAEAKVQIDSEEYTRPDKFGSSTVKPAAEFLSYRSWINSTDSFLHGDYRKGWDYLMGGTPSWSAGEVSKGLEKNIGGGGRHRKPSAVNLLGRFGSKVFGWPVALVATAVDYYYTPPGEFDRDKTKDTKVVAPRDPGSRPVKWK